jgi:iron complex outermembrane recepter protein
MPKWEMKHTITICIAVLLFGSAFSQTPCDLRVGGYLRYSEDSLGVSDAEIFIEDLHIKAHTNVDGYFELKRICPGQLLLEFDLPNKVHIHHFIEIHQDTSISIFVSRSAIKLDAAHVTGKPNQQTIGEEAILNQTGKGLTDLLTTMPGVQALQTGNAISKPMLDGFYGQRVPMFINGVRQEGQQWGAEHGTEADPLSYNQIAVHQGTAVLRKAHDAYAGIVELNSKPEAHAGEVNINSGSAFATNNRQVAVFSKISSHPWNTNHQWYVNLSSRRGGNYRSPGYYLLNTGIFDVGLNAGLEKVYKHKTDRWNLSYYHFEGGIFSGSRIGNVTDLLQAIQRTQPLYGVGQFAYPIKAPKQQSSHLQGQYEITTSNSKFLLSLQANHRSEYDLHRSRKFSFPQLDLYLLNIDIRNDANTAFLRHKTIQWGWSSSMWAHRYAGYFFLPDFLANATGVYGLRKTRLGGFIWENALRADGKIMAAQWVKGGIKHTKARIFGNIAASSTLSKALPTGKYSMSLQRLWRSPWLNELYSEGVHHSAASFEKGNDALRSEVNYKLETQYEAHHKNSQFYIRGYAHYIRNFINLTPSEQPVLTVRGAFPAYEYKQFDALYTGVDANLQFPLTPALDLRNQAGITYARNLESNLFPSFIPPAFLQTGLHYHYKYIYGYVELRRQFQQAFYSEGTDYLPPPEAYSLINAGFRIENVGRKQRLSLAIEGQNLGNVVYRNYLDRFRYFADMPGRNISLRLSYNFHHHQEHTD